MAENGDTIAGRPDKTYSSVYGNAINGDERLFSGSFDGVSSILLKADTQGTTLLLDESMVLPEAEFVIRSIVPYLLENGSFYFTERTPDYLTTALFHDDASGTITTVLKTDDPLGSEGAFVSGFYSLQRFKEKLYISENNVGLVELGTRRVDIAIAANSPVLEGGVMRNVSSSVAVTDTTAYLLQAYVPPGGGQREGLFAWDGTNLRLVFSPTHFDALRISSVNFAALSDADKIYSQILYNGSNNRAIVGTTGANVADPFLVIDPLEYELLSSTIIRVYIPAGRLSEKSTDLQAIWTEGAWLYRFQYTS